jgi:vacuolar-type H+-ATPase subunit H
MNMMDPAWLATTGASAFVTAMLTEAWTVARSQLAELFAGQDSKREQEENGRLEGFAEDLTKTSEHDVQNRLRGFLEARLSHDPALADPFFVLVKQTCAEIGLEPPTHWTTINASDNSIVVAGDAHVRIGSDRIVWEAMTSHEAAHKLGTLERSHAVQELARMDPASAARRLFHVEDARAADLLSHMYEGLAANLLSRTSAPHSAELLALMEPLQGAAVLEHMDADWAVARLSEMDPDRALVLIGALGSKRTDDLLAAMERQQTVRLLGSVSKVLADQARIRMTFDLAEQEAKQIVSEAHRRAKEIIDEAQQRAAEFIAVAEHEAAAKREVRDQLDPDPANQRTQLAKKILEVLAANPDKMLTARDLAKSVHATIEETRSALGDLERVDEVYHHHRAGLYGAKVAT